MNIKNRLRKMEDVLNLDSEFCRCEREIVIRVEPRDENDESRLPEACTDCGKEISRLFCTFKFTGETQIIEPRANFTREEFEAHQNRHTISRHITYEQHLKEQSENEY